MLARMLANKLTKLLTKAAGKDGEGQRQLRRILSSGVGRPPSKLSSCSKFTNRWIFLEVKLKREMLPGRSCCWWWTG